MSDQNAPALSLTDLFGPVISSYTRADALADGTLHDLTDLAKEARVSQAGPHRCICLG